MTGKQIDLCSAGGGFWQTGKLKERIQALSADGDRVVRRNASLATLLL